MLTAVLAAAFLGVSSSAASEADFENGMKALTAKDYSTALLRLEAALAGDADNIRYGSEYRQAVIAAKEFDRAIQFFEKLVAGNPKAPNAFLNYGFAYVDKIPAAGSITQVILANTALSHFSKSIELKPSWIALYTRGNSYLYWPKIFNRAHLGVADLEEAMKMQKADTRRKYHIRAYVSLGDGHWKMDNIEKARAVWKEGLALFPESAALKARLSKEGDDLKAYIDDVLDPNKRVDTNLREIWASE
ncbi:MAG: tetratricopeptide repeat protein [Bryobacteraceae bacterium]